MRKLIYVALLLSFVFIPAQKTLAQDYFCAVYFTAIGCPNCAVTDPILLTEWTNKYSNLVIIEYSWKDFNNPKNPNPRLFGEYINAYRIQSAVPQIIISKKNIRLGRIEVPKAERDIQKKKFNPCPLVGKSVSFENLDLKELPGLPKIWANGRILIKLNENEWIFQWNGENPPRTIGKENFSQKELKDLFFTDNISKKLENKIFDIVEPQKVEFSGSVFPASYGFVPYAEFENAIKIDLSKEITPPPHSGKQEKPTQTTTETQTATEKEISEEEAEEETVNLPLIGEIETKEFSLPLLTLLIALADGFNPCAFFVLTFLLAALIGLAGARKKILLVGGIFILFSALLYFLFMSVLLNVFQLGAKVTVLTLIAGGIALFAGIINIKDYFYFQKGISLTLPKSYKEKFIQRVKNLSLAKSTFALILGTIIIALTVNIYELLCTFGFPMVYMRVLTLRELSSLQYYLYLAFYNLVYVIPLGIIFLIFSITLGRKTFSQLWVRRLKLVSGFMIVFLGLVLMIKPVLLENVLTAFEILFLAIIISGIIILIDSLWKKKR